MDGTSEKIIQRVLKINASTKSLVKRLCDLNLTKATLKAEAHALHCTTAGPYNAIPTCLLGVGSVCGFGPDLVGIHSVCLAARYRTAACSNTLNQGLEKIQAARAFDFAPILALCTTWEKEFLAPSMARSTADAFNKVCRLDRNGKLDEVSQDKKQKVATSLFCDKLHTQDFAGPISLRASKFLGLVSRYRIVDTLYYMKLASRASRPGRTLNFHIFFNGLCTAQRFYAEGEEQTCKLDARMSPTLSVSHYNACPLLYNMFTSLLGHATVLPRRSHLLHDLITQVYLRSLQYGIVVMGFIDAFVYAHHQHRQNIDNPGNFWDCMKGGICFMTAITSAYAHAYHVKCLTRQMPAVPRLNFRLPKSKARYPHLTNVRTTTRERFNDFQGWGTYTDGCPRHVDGETLSWMVCYRSITSWENSCLVWSGHHRRGSSCFFRCQNSLQ